MREQCGHCGEVFSVTHSPNNLEGFFLSEVILDQHDGSELAYYRLRAIGGIAAVQCPKCQMITPT